MGLPARYRAYARVLVTHEDLRGLRERQRQALFERVALGLTLVVTFRRQATPSAPSARPSTTSSGPSASWRGNAGGEIREAPLLWGRIRRTTLDTATPRRTPTTPRSSPGCSSRPQKAGRTPSGLQARGGGRGCRSAPGQSHRLLLALSVATVLVLLIARGRAGARPALPSPSPTQRAPRLAPDPLLRARRTRARATRSGDRVTVHDGVRPRRACVGTYVSGGGRRPIGTVPLPLGVAAADARGRLRRPRVPQGSCVRPEGLRRHTFSDACAPDSLSCPRSPAEYVQQSPLWEADVRGGSRLSGTLRRGMQYGTPGSSVPTLSEKGGCGACPRQPVDVAVLAPVRGTGNEAGLGALRRVFMGSAEHVVDTPRVGHLRDQPGYLRADGDPARPGRQHVRRRGQHVSGAPALAPSLRPRASRGLEPLLLSMIQKSRESTEVSRRHPDHARQRRRGAAPTALRTTSSPLIPLSPSARTSSLSESWKRRRRNRQPARQAREARSALKLRVPAAGPRPAWTSPSQPGNPDTCNSGSEQRFTTPGCTQLDHAGHYEQAARGAQSLVREVKDDFQELHRARPPYGPGRRGPVDLMEHSKRSRTTNAALVAIRCAPRQGSPSGPSPPATVAGGAPSAPDPRHPPGRTIRGRLVAQVDLREDGPGVVALGVGAWVTVHCQGAQGGAPFVHWWRRGSRTEDRASACSLEEGRERRLEALGLSGALRDALCARDLQAANPLRHVLPVLPREGPDREVNLGPHAANTGDPKPQRAASFRFSGCDLSSSSSSGWRRLSHSSENSSSVSPTETEDRDVQETPLSLRQLDIMRAPSRAQR